MPEVLGILALTIVAPLAIILHYVTEWKKHRGLSSEDERMLDEVYDVMNAMEERLNTLESILDAEGKDWREDHDYDERPKPRRTSRGKGDTPTYPREAS